MTAKTPEQLVSVYGDMVYRLAYAQTRSRHDADDIFQEVFLQTVRKRPVFDSVEHEKAWLLRVTLNCLKSHWRSMAAALTHRSMTAFRFPSRRTAHWMKLCGG